MDEIDIAITKELAADPRIAYRDLADKLSLSVNAVHKRIQLMVSKGIIAGFRIRLSPQVTGGGFLSLYGRSQSLDLTSTLEQLGSHPCTHRIIAAGGQFLYVDAFVRSNEEMQDFIAFVRETGKMDELKTIVMVMFGPPPEKDPLTKTDYRIISSLSPDCRRPLQEVAEEIGSTYKTVKRRLENMEAQRQVYYAIDWVPSSSGDIVSMVHAKSRPTSSVKDIATAMINRKDPHILGISASNVEPGLLLFSMWARDLRELRDAEGSLNSNSDFESMYSNLFYDMRTFTTWIDKTVADRAK